MLIYVPRYLLAIRLLPKLPTITAPARDLYTVEV
jgi:hypothetical protein